MRRRFHELGYVAICVAIAVTLTWPLARVFTTRICGDPGDPFQTLWGLRWIRDALVSFRNPFFTDRVFYPTGSTLVFQTFDLPSAIAVAPLWGLLPEVAIYNTAVLIALTVTAYGMFRLVREQTGDVAVALAAGAIFAAVPYQFAHLQGHLHLLGMGWLPLFLVHVLRVVDGRARLRDGVYGGLFLALATLASWYHLLYALVLVAALAAHAVLVDRRALTASRTIRAGGALAVTWIALVGPLLVAILVARAREPITGSHDPLTFSADLYAFAFPNAAQRWSGVLGAHAAGWTGNATETAVYAGYTLVVLAVVGAWTAARARPFVGAAVVAAVLALGPRLHVDGRLTDVTLPYAYLERVIPLLGFTGVPVRFGYVMYLGLTVAAAFGLVRLRALAERRGRAAAHAAVAVPLLLVLLEYFPRPLVTFAYPDVPPLRAWANDPTPFAVLDVSDHYRAMWHATIHRKPMLGAYLSRVPERLESAYQRDPVVRPILFEGSEAWFMRVDAGVDFAWGDAGPGGPILPDAFHVVWVGALVVPTSGTYDLWLAADDAGFVAIDGRLVLRRVGPCPSEGECVAHERIELAAGSHPLRIEYRQKTDAAAIHLWWQPPGSAREIVPTSALRTEDGRPGISGEYLQPVEGASGLGTAGGRSALRARGVRYVIVTADRPNPAIERDLRLPLTYEGEGIRIYEVPPDGE